MDEPLTAPDASASASAGRPRLDPGGLARAPRTGPTDPIQHYDKPLVGWLFRERINRGLALLPHGGPGVLGSVLEVGYAAGMVQLALAPHASDLHGIDLDAEPAEVTATLRRAGVESELLRGSVLELPYGENRFDHLVCFSVLEHLTEYRAALAEMARVTRPGGALLLGMPAVNRMMELAIRALGHSREEVLRHHVTTPRQVLEAMAELGLEVRAEAPLGLRRGPRLYSNWLVSPG